MQALIEASIQGDRKAQRQIFDAYGSSLYAVALRYCRQAANAQDVMQESWIKIFSNLGAVNNYDTFYAWCKKIVVNTALRALQHRWLDTELTDTMASLDTAVDPTILADLSYDAIRGAVDRLPESYRDIFLWLYVEKSG